MKRLLERLLGDRPPTAQQVIAVTKTYIRADLAPFLEVSPQAPVRIELPFRGRRNLSWIVTLGDKKVMMRCYMPDQRNEMHTHVTALRLMEQNDVYAPKLIHAIETPAKYGVLFAASEFVTGEGRGGQQQLSMDEVRCLATQAAQLHSIHSPSWGTLSEASKGDYFAELIRMVERYTARAEKFEMLTAAQRAQMKKWFSNWREKFSDLNSYSLVHGDLHPNNVLFNDAGGCCLVDTDEFFWGLGMWDVALIHDRGCRQEEERIRVFDETYLARLQEADRLRHQRLMPFFEAFYRLRAVMRAVRLKERKQDRITTPRALKGDLWEQLLRISVGQ